MLLIGFPSFATFFHEGNLIHVIMYKQQNHIPKKCYQLEQETCRSYITHLCGSVERKTIMAETDTGIESTQPKT
jgi:hypothetical protein